MSGEMLRHLIFPGLLLVSGLGHAAAAWLLSGTEPEPIRELRFTEGRTSVAMIALQPTPTPQQIQQEMLEEAIQPVEDLAPPEVIESVPLGRRNIERVAYRDPEVMTPDIPPVAPPERVEVDRPPTEEPDLAPPKIERSETEQEIEEPNEIQVDTPIVPATEASNEETGRLDEEPTLVANPQPQYPVQARISGAQGKVWVNVRIGVDGRVLSASLHKSSGHSVLDTTAVQAVQSTWKFNPAKRNGKAVEYDGKVFVTFNLKG